MVAQPPRPVACYNPKEQLNCVVKAIPTIPAQPILAVQPQICYEPPIKQAVLQSPNRPPTPYRPAPLAPSPPNRPTSPPPLGKSAWPSPPVGFHNSTGQRDSPAGPPGPATLISILAQLGLGFLSLTRLGAGHKGLVNYTWV